MINCFQKIKNVGCYEEFSFDSNRLPLFNQVNILFGNNGSGKTTLTNLLFLLSKHCKNKHVLFSGLFHDGSEIELRFDGKKISEKDIKEKDLDIYVFNSKFISDHVYNGSIANLDSFSDEVKLTNEVIDSLDHSLKRCRARIHKLQAWQNQMNSKFDNIWETLKNQFQKTVKEARLTGIKPDITRNEEIEFEKAQKELDDLYVAYKKKSQEESTIKDLEKLKSDILAIPLLELDFDLLASKLLEIASSKVKTNVSTQIEKISEVLKTKNPQLQDSIHEWFRYGGRLLFYVKGETNTCPLCDSDLENRITQIIEDYTIHFSNALINLLKFITEANTAVTNAVNLNLVEQCIRSISNLSSLALTAFKIDIHFDESLEAEKLQEAIFTLSQNLNQKLNNPEVIIQVQEHDIFLMKEFNSKVNQYKQEATKKIDDELNKLKGLTLSQLTNQIKSKISQVAISSFNRNENKLLSTTKANYYLATKLNVLISELTKKIQELESDRGVELSKLNAESKYINLYLENFGINHFYIETEKSVSQNNIRVIYKQSGKKTTDFQHSLSEGEKTALAFSYFISKIRVEKIEGSSLGLKNSIIVIDDPISSLDDNRLFQTANLIDSFFFYNQQSEDNHPLQLFVFSHNIIFAKYIYNAFRTNPKLEDKTNEYYLSNDDPKLRKLPSSLKNFTNTYLVKLREIVEFTSKNKNYEDVKNYLPNYIRIVLETFLSFKLALVNDSGKDILPGMQYLINHMVKEIEPLEERNDGGLSKDSIIKRLNHLKKIADHESHGNIFKAQEYSYISEAELREFAKNTLQVINYLDGLHYKGVKNLV